MKKLALGLVMAVLIFVVIPFTYSTAKGYMTWWFCVPGARVAVDGSPVDAWVHRGQTWQDMILTLTEGNQGVSYYWIIGKDRVNGRCPVAPALPVFPEGDLMDPDCFQPAPTGYVAPDPPERKIESGPRFIRFTADDGKRIEVRW